MNNRFGKTLLAITTYNQLHYTKICIDSIKNLDEVPLDLLVVDDCSDDGTVDWCKENGIQVADKHKPMGLTHSWNAAYRYFRDTRISAGLGSHKYKYLIIANNDIIVPKNSITELLRVAGKWPFSVVVPLSTDRGAGHNKNIQGIQHAFSNISNSVDDSKNYQLVQNHLLEIKENLKKENNLFMIDPRRMKMFNGFFFLMTRNVINYESKDGTLFDSTKPLYKAEDEFNWAKLIPNNDYPAVCYTSFIYHFKGISTTNFSNEHNTIDSFTKQRNIIDKEK